MDQVTETATKLVDMLPAYGSEKLDILHGWAIKIMLVSALVELLMSLGTWKSFGWMLVFQLILSAVGLWLNRHGKDTGVWIVAILSILVYPITRIPWIDGKFNFSG